jgi:hypothetical protein
MADQRKIVSRVERVVGVARQRWHRHDRSAELIVEQRRFVHDALYPEKKPGGLGSIGAAMLSNNYTLGDSRDLMRGPPTPTSTNRHFCMTIWFSV